MGAYSSPTSRGALLPLLLSAARTPTHAQFLKNRQWRYHDHDGETRPPLPAPPADPAGPMLNPLLSMHKQEIVMHLGTTSYY